MQVVEVQGRSGLPHVHVEAYQHLTPAQQHLLTTLQEGDSSTLSHTDLRALVELATAAMTVSTSPTLLLQQFPLLSAEQAQEVVRLALLHQHHTCTPNCTVEVGHGQQCSLWYPCLPSLLPLVARRPDLQDQGERDRLEEVERLHRRVQGVLRARHARGELGEEVQVAEVEKLLEVLRETGPAPQALPQGGFTWQGVAFPQGQELDTLRQECITASGVALGGQDLLLVTLYQASLLVRRHPLHLPQRRVCEVLTCNFNPWMLLALQISHELDLVAATPSKLYKGST